MTGTAQDALADLELVVRVVVDDRYCVSAESQVDGAYVFVCCPDCCSGFDVICRVDDDHARDGSHECDVFIALMGRAVFTDGDGCVGRTDLDVQMRISDCVADLLKCAACCEHGK